jgi:hypothetical protein
MLSLVVNCPIQAWDKKSDTALVVLQRSCRFLRISPGPPDLWALPLEPKTFRSCRWSTRAAATCLVSGTWSSKNRHVSRILTFFPSFLRLLQLKTLHFRMVNFQSSSSYSLKSMEVFLATNLRLPFTNYHVWLAGGKTHFWLAAPPRVVQDLILEGHLLHFSPCRIPTLGYRKLPKFWTSANGREHPLLCWITRWLSNVKQC